MWPLLFAGVLAPGAGENDPWTEDWPAASAAFPSDPEDSPFSLGALLRGFYTASPKEAREEDAEVYVSGFVLEDADVYLSYREEDVGWRVSADLDAGGVELEDAYAQWQHFDWLALTVGQFKPRVLRSSAVPAGELLFRERTLLGAAFDAWDAGVELGGHYDQFDYWLAWSARREAAQSDTSNGTDSDHLWSARAEWALNDVAFEDREGARGSADYMRVILGVTWFADDTPSSADGAGYGADLALTFGPYSLHGEWADLDQEFLREIDVFNGHLIELGDGRPFAATLSRRVGPEGELGLRFQRADEADATESFGLCTSWSPGNGRARFVADLELVEGDTRDFSLFSLGLQLGSSGLSRPFAGIR